MNSNKYYFGIIARVIFIVISSLLLAFISYKTNYLYTISVLVLIVLLQTWGLIRYILKRRDDIKRMLEYIRENNPTMYFSESRDYPFNELGYFLNEIGNIVREVRIEKEHQLQYMQFIVQHVSIGLLSFDNEGNIEIINQAAKDIIGLSDIHSINLLEKVHPGLPELLIKMKVGEPKVITMTSGTRLLKLAVRISVFKIGKKEIRLLSLQDIKNELDEKEMDSWQKLIRVLTHEIINSVTPITSLTTTITGFFKKGNEVIPAKDLEDEKISEALTGLGYIEDRGKNLVDFVSRFRSLTKLPEPKFEQIRLSEMLDAIVLLKKEDMSSKKIVLKCNVSPEDMILVCDRNLIEHVLLNLINNASDAIESIWKNEGGIIEITGYKTADNRSAISVTDNGSGIPDDLADNIFIPFFTTKPNGSGIGLSLSRQIMKLHGGTISVFSQQNKMTSFLLFF
jgi:two-component system nitrogen regulation sensor histidine kinase NtrY